MAATVLVVLLVSMEVLREPPLLRVFVFLGFFCVAILFVMTSVDELSRQPSPARWRAAKDALDSAEPRGSTPTPMPPR